LSTHADGHVRGFIVLAIAVVVALVISPLIFQGISSANSTGKITGTLATIVNLIPLFYYLAVAVIAIAVVIDKLRVFKQTIDLQSLRRGLLHVIQAITRTTSLVVLVFYEGIRPLGA